MLTFVIPRPTVAGGTHRSQVNKKLRPYLAAKMDHGRKGGPPAEKKVKMGRTHLKISMSFENLHVKMGRTLFGHRG